MTFYKKKKKRQVLLDTCVHHKLEHERPFSTSGLIPSFHVFRDVSLV